MAVVQCGCMKKALILLCIVIGSAGCRPLETYFIKPAGPPEYQLGWQDGCDTGLSAYGTLSHRIAYGFNKRPEMGSSEQYKQGWNEGFTYCRFVQDVNHPIEADVKRTGMWWD